ncbi:MAG TPA: Ig-like domain-containing protein, partial [Acidimicrobiales bacterium]|nr:Ig-like domain-containing protein [Acidimicrobiales bacterium]
DLTATSTWASSNTATATISSSGLATGKTTGAVTISATDPTSLVQGTAALTVTSASLVALTVTPPIASVPAGETVQFTATAHYSDLSTQDVTTSVTWTSSGAAATVSNSTHSHGLATGQSVGAVTITATDPSSLIQGTAALTITPAVLASIAVSPAASAIAQGQTQQFKATGHYSDQTVQDLTMSVTWSSSSASVATASNTAGSQGLATGVGAGSVLVTATDSLSGVHGSAQLSVGQTPLLVITPSAGPAGAAVQAQAFSFHPRSSITIYYLVGKRSHRICHARVATNGALQCNGTIPVLSRAGAMGQHTMVAKGWRGHLVTTTFMLTN